MIRTDIIDSLQDKHYWLIDILPKQVPAGSAEALITFSGDDHYMTLYNPDEKLLALAHHCASAEGLFVWGPEQAEPRPS